MKKILLVSTCENKLHELEFIRPIINIIKEKFEFEINHYINIKESDIEKFDKIIICGTSLKDNKYLQDIEKFNWILKTKKPILGICAGFQIICQINKSKVKEIQEIGLIKDIKIIKKDIILKNIKLNEVYALHNYYNSVPKNYEILAKNDIPQIIKKENIYAILFHPEVRNKEIINNFCELK
jgi:GMP synthase-like glutamine amidotransferase